MNTSTEWEQDEKAYLDKKPRSWQDALKEAEGYLPAVGPEESEGFSLPEPIGALIGKDKQNQFQSFINGLLQFMNVNADKVMPKKPEDAKTPEKVKPKTKIRSQRFNEEFEEPGY